MAAPRQAPSFGTDYSQVRGYGPRAPPPGRHNYADSMLNRLNRTLTDAIWTPGAEPNEDDYQFKSVNDMKQNFVGGGGECSKIVSF